MKTESQISEILEAMRSVKKFGALIGANVYNIEAFEKLLEWVLSDVN